jgi:S1-C subfamily serine protease
VTSDGYALTNNHVVEDFDEVSHNRRQVETIRSFFDFQKLKPAMWVILNGHPYRAKLIYRSDTRDYAILKIPVTDAPFFRLSTDEEPARLTEVMALGFPGAARISLSDADARDISRRHRQARTIASSPLVEHDYVLTDGKVTSIAARSDARWIQHNAAISPGNSGGPLVDANCVVLGINTQYAADAQGTFFALQLKQIKSRIERYVPNSTWR